MGRFNNNTRYAQLTEDQLKKLFEMHIRGYKYDGTITSIQIVSTKNENNSKEPFAVQVEFVTIEYGREEQYLLFNRFTIEEWDYIHECLELNGVLPVSEFILRKNNHIVNVECSNRGYESRWESIKKTISNTFN